jgi:GNAT superfamily N-acetyltransferase
MCAQAYVSCHSGSVVGFYSLAVGSVEPSNAASRVTKGIPQHPVPVMMLARLAVVLQHQGAGLGKALPQHLERRSEPQELEQFTARGLVHPKAKHLLVEIFRIFNPWLMCRGPYLGHGLGIGG